MIPLLAGLVDDAGLFPPSSLPMSEALDRHRRSTSRILSGRFLCPGDRLNEMLDLLGEDENLDIHIVADGVVELPTDPRITVRAVETRAVKHAPAAGPCYVEDVPPSELKGRGLFGKLRCGGSAIPTVEEVAGYLREAARHSVPFKATAGMHAAVRGWESTDGVPHHGYLNLLLGVVRALAAGDIDEVLSCTHPDTLAAEARALPAPVMHAARRLLHSYGSCDTVRPAADAKRLGLL